MTVWHEQLKLWLLVGSSLALVRADVNRACSHGEQFPFCNTSLSIDDRTQDLVDRLAKAGVNKGELMTARRSAPVPSLGIPAYDWGCVNLLHLCALTT